MSTVVSLSFSISKCSETKSMKHHQELNLVLWAMKEQLLSKFLWVVQSRFCDLQGTQNICHTRQTISDTLFSTRLYYFHNYIHNDSIQPAVSLFPHTQDNPEVSPSLSSSKRLSRSNIDLSAPSETRNRKTPLSHKQSDSYDEDSSGSQHHPFLSRYSIQEQRPNAVLWCCKWVFLLQYFLHAETIPEEAFSALLLFFWSSLTC